MMRLLSGQLPLVHRLSFTGIWNFGCHACIRELHGEPNANTEGVARRTSSEFQIPRRMTTP